MKATAGSWSIFVIVVWFVSITASVNLQECLSILCMFVCTERGMHMRVYVYLCIYIYTYIHKHKYIYVYTHTYTRASYTRAWTYASLSVKYRHAQSRADAVLVPQHFRISSASHSCKCVTYRLMQNQFQTSWFTR